jgi:hypothetical protein
MVRNHASKGGKVMLMHPKREPMAWPTYEARSSIWLTGDWQLPH